MSVETLAAHYLKTANIEEATFLVVKAAA